MSPDDAAAGLFISENGLVPPQYPQGLLPLVPITAPAQRPMIARAACGWNSHELQLPFREPVQAEHQPALPRWARPQLAVVPHRGRRAPRPPALPCVRPVGTPALPRARQASGVGGRGVVCRVDHDVVLMRPVHHHVHHQHRRSVAVSCPLARSGAPPARAGAAGAASVPSSR